MEKIKRFVECLIPFTACNLRCDYCYVMQENRRDNNLSKFNYSPEYIGKALNKKRLGGVSLISMTGAGETMLAKEMPQIINEVLKQGHYVNITTNGTLKNRFEELSNIVDENDIKRLHISFSFHYLELKNKNLLDDFFYNVNLMKKKGASILVQLNLYDGYVPYLDEIKNICLNKIGALPQIAATRLEDVKKTSIYKVKLHTSLSDEEYKKIGETFSSPLFDYTMKNFNKKQTKFCYAGQWSILLNLATGDITRCYFEAPIQNIYKNINEKIKFKPVGNNCKCLYCFNSTHFQSLGIIPEIKGQSYGELRNRKSANWYSSNMEQFLNTKLYDNNKEYSKIHKLLINKTYLLTYKKMRLIYKLKSRNKNEK